MNNPVQSDQVVTTTSTTAKGSPTSSRSNPSKKKKKNSSSKHSTRSSSRGKSSSFTEGVDGSGTGASNKAQGKSKRKRKPTKPNSTASAPPSVETTRTTTGIHQSVITEPTNNDMHEMQREQPKSPSSGIEAFQVAYEGSVSQGSGSPTSSHKDTMMEETGIGGDEQEAQEQPRQEGSVEDLACEKISTLEQRYCRCFKTKTRCFCCFFLLLLIVVAAVILPLYFTDILFDKDGDGNVEIQRLADFPKDQVISAAIGMDICNEWIPGQGHSQICEVDPTTSVHGGDVCNILVQAMLNTTEGAEIAMVNAATCIGDISWGDLRAGGIATAIQGEELYIIEVSGADIYNLLEDVMEVTFGEGSDGDGATYPYAAGLRFGVDANLGYGSRVKETEAMDYDLTNDWRPLSSRKFYKVITTKRLAAEGNRVGGYTQFTNVIDKWKTPLGYQTVDAFLQYVLDNDMNWWIPNTEVYSTQRFVPSDTEPPLAKVPNDICKGWAPDSTSTSVTCRQGTAVVGGGLCNFVAWALLDQNLQEADMVLLNGGICGSEDLPSGDFVLSNANAMMPGDPSLATVEITGSKIVSLLENAFDAFYLAESGQERYDAYPFCSGIRFNVNTLEEKGERLSEIQFFTRSNRWVSLNNTRLYKVLTTSEMARGNDPIYGPSFQSVLPARLTEISKGSVDTILKYAFDWEVLLEPPREKHSTQLFIG